MNNLSGAVKDLKLYALTPEGKLQQMQDDLWLLRTEDGETPETLEDGTLYELWVTASDDGDFDLDDGARSLAVRVVLAS